MAAYRLGMKQSYSLISQFPEAARSGIIPDHQDVGPWLDKVKSWPEKRLDDFIFKYDKNRPDNYPFFDSNGLSYLESAKSKGLYRKLSELKKVDIDSTSYEYGLKLLLEGVAEIIDQLKEDPERYEYLKSTTEKIKQARKHWVKNNKEIFLEDALSYIPLGLHRDIDLLWDGIEGWSA